MITKQDVLLRSRISKVGSQNRVRLWICESQVDKLAGRHDEGWTPLARIRNWLTLVRASPPENASSASAEVDRPEGTHVSGDMVDATELVSIVIDPDPRKTAVGGR